MKNKLYVSIGLFALALVGAISVSAQSSGAQPSKLDLSVRTALYFTGAKADSWDKYVVKDGTMELKMSQGTGCDGTYCEFNIGFISWAERAGKNGEVSTYGLFTVDNGSMVGNTIYFADKELIKKGIHAVKLKLGMNKVTFTIDPYEKTAETDENNNSFSVNFKVNAPIRTPGKKFAP
ncbi:MAG: hypothetical protein H0U50_05540 [Pyrinomonadaceae bacterium]|nr:hypothetical protein [Pyrinomonadaceae bacterium]